VEEEDEDEEEEEVGIGDGALRTVVHACPAGGWGTGVHGARVCIHSPPPHQAEWGRFFVPDIRPPPPPPAPSSSYRVTWAPVFIIKLFPSVLEGTSAII